MRRINHRLLLFLLLLPVLCGAEAVARDQVIERAWLEDAEGTLSYDQVQTQPMQPFKGVLTRGIGEGVIWIRLSIDPAGQETGGGFDTDTKLVLRVRPAYLDEVALFDPLSGTQPKLSGDHYPVSQDDYASLNLNFVIPRGEAPRDLYLRVSTTSTRMIEANVFPLTELQHQDRNLLIFSGLYFGVGALFFFWALITWLTARDPIIFAFIFSQLGALGVGFTIFGYARLWLSDALGAPTVDALLTVSVLFSIFSASWFYLRLITEIRATPIALWGLRLMMALMLIAALLLIAGQVRLTVTLIWYSVLGMPLLALLGVLLARGWRDAERKQRLLPRWVLLFYIFSNLLVLLIAVVAGKGIIENASAFTMYAPLTNGLVSGLLAVALLQYRQRISEQRQSQLLADLAVSRQHAEQEKTVRMEREQLLAMLGHELKTPLAAMRLLLGKAEPDSTSIASARKAMLEMNTVIERTLQAGRLDGGESALRLAELNPADTIRALIAQCPEADSILFDSTEPGTLSSDPDLLRIILMNLIDNACKYRAPHTAVHIALTSATQTDATGVQREGIAISVQNVPGTAGVPEANKLFDKYYRSPMAHRQAGAGLGLYIAKRLATQLGGQLEYRASNALVTFTLWLAR